MRSVLGKVNSRSLGGGYLCADCAEVYPNGEEFRSCPIHGNATAWRPDLSPTLSEDRAQRRRDPATALAYTEFEAYYQRTRGLHPAVESLPTRDELALSTSE